MRFQCYFIKREITLKREIIQIRKKIRVTYFFMRNPYMKFQSISILGYKVMLCTRKRHQRTNEHANGQARSNMSPNFFKVGGIKSYIWLKRLMCFKNVCVLSAGTSCNKLFKSLVWKNSCRT